MTDDLPSIAPAVQVTVTDDLPSIAPAVQVTVTDDLPSIAPAVQVTVTDDLPSNAPAVQILRLLCRSHAVTDDLPSIAPTVQDTDDLPSIAPILCRTQMTTKHCEQQRCLWSQSFKSDRFSHVTRVFDTRRAVPAVRGGSKAIVNGSLLYNDALFWQGQI